MAKYARIIVNRHHQRVDRVFTYKIPASLSESVQAGMMVEVPFGTGDTHLKGYCVGTADECEIEDSKLKELCGLLDPKPLFSSEDLSLATYIADRYGAPLSSALTLFVPRVPGTDLPETQYFKLVKYPEKNLGKNQRAIVDYLRDAQDQTARKDDVLAQTGSTLASAKTLEEQGFLERFSVRETPVPYDEKRWERANRPQLNKAQHNALMLIGSAMEEDRYEGFLLFGVTGSGKTYVYLNMAHQLIAQGKQMILLVPEISLTPQYIEILESYFGERVGVMHSGLSDGERTRRYLRAKEGFYDIVVGPRSALFMPLKNLGAVVIDEEHESTYKSDEMPTFYAREVAEELCRRKGIPLVLGSATPSVESFWRAQNGELTLLSMPDRATGTALPSVTVVDTKAEMAEGNMSFFSEPLRRAIADRLARGEQTILFLNRKGYASFSACRACGFVLRCPKCYLPYTYHKDKGALICHHCGKSVAMPDHCPNCGSPYLMSTGIGTQRVEEEAKSFFPAARIRRMDLDAAGDEGYESIYQDMADGCVDILIGTQMVAKGFDFPKVTLVGVIAADLSLYSPDYHASERTFELITQAVGRAGRHSGGEAVIQTFSPDHYCIREAARQSYEGFYKEEIMARELAGVPPFEHLLQILVSGRNENSVREDVAGLYRLMERLGRNKGFVLMGPSPASLGRVNNVFRWKILARSTDAGRLVRYGAYCIDRYLEETRNSTITMDLDPGQIL